MSKNKSKIYKKKGNTIKDLTRKILHEFNKEPKKILNYKQLSSKLMISDSNGRNQIIKKLEELKGQDKISEISRGKFIIKEESHYFDGIVEITSRGNAYVICEDLEHDVYVPSRNLNKALNNDLVKVYVYKRKKNKKQEGDIVEILKRDKTDFVGVLQLNKNFGFVIPDDPKMYSDIFISESKLNEAKNGDKVLVKIKDWPKNSKNPFGEIKLVLGRPGDHNTEIHSILLEYGLPYTFPKEVEDFAAKLPLDISEEEIANRRDMRAVPTFTIDPKDAKDFDDALSFQILENGNYEFQFHNFRSLIFDDALSFQILENGNYEIGIHIADVSHYLQENTILEEEAYQRATSVYLVDRVVPMLPEILSNNVCSLRPKEEKLSFSVIFELDEKAHVIKEWFGRTVIYSDKRFTYEEAQSIIDYDANDKDNIDFAIVKINDLAKKIRKIRMQHGAISFDRTEVKFELDKDANPIGVFVKESNDSNKLIEEFMLLANRKVAEFIGKKKNQNSPNKTFIYRIHDEPNIDKLAALQGIISNFGYRINTESKKSTSQSLNKLLADVHGRSESNMIETLTIRSMSKAIYSTDNIGHYGLAFDYYTHFTSPIRRYPDVMVHRLLQHYLDGGKSPKIEIYEEKCKHSSEREYMASRAERDSIKYMQIKYMQDHRDIKFKGVISGVTEWGIYVEIIENKCEGLIRVKDIKNDYYIFDDKQYALVGQVTKNLYQLGDEVTVMVKHTDLERKHLDFSLIE